LPAALPRRGRAPQDDGCGHLQSANEDHPMTEQKPTARPDTPFPKHWLYYIAIKIALLAGATALVLKLYNFW
jgi:hypothetical protein